MNYAAGNDSAAVRDCRGLRFCPGVGVSRLWAADFDSFAVPQPIHKGYVQFGSFMLVIFGTMFFAVAYDPVANRNLILYGMLLKLSYTGRVIYYWVAMDCPQLFKPFAVIDALMFVLFFLAYTKRRAPA
jgi:hypothetical protein